MPDEIRIQVDGEHASGTVTVTFAAKPDLHFLRVYGTKGMVELDINTMTKVFHPVSALPKAAQQATFNVADRGQRTRRTLLNTVQLLTGRLKPYRGTMSFLHEFYDALREKRSLPVSKDRALAVVRAMHTIVAKLEPTNFVYERVVPARPKSPGARRVLVTGGTGFVGRALVKRLIAEGYAVRVLARKLARVEPLIKLGAEISWGDVADLESFSEAFESCDVVVHLAAGTSGTEQDGQTGTLQGTRNALELCRRHKPRRLVYISSCSVYGVANYRANAVVSEASWLERFPERRGAYSASKHAAEGYITDYMSTGDVPVVVLRPGTIYGPGGELYTPMMGFSLGRLFVVIGMGGFVLPLVYVDNLAEAIVGSIAKKEAEGGVFNVVDPEPINKRQYVDRVVRRVHRNATVVYLPYAALYAAHLVPGSRIQTNEPKARPHAISADLLTEEHRVQQREDRLAARLEAAGAAESSAGSSRGSSGDAESTDRGRGCASVAGVEARGRRVDIVDADERVTEHTGGAEAG